MHRFDGSAHAETQFAMKKTFPQMDDQEVHELKRDQLGEGVRGKYFKQFTQDDKPLVSKGPQLEDGTGDSTEEETLSPTNLSDEERAELHRRLEEHQADPSSSIPWEQVRTSPFKGHI